jgi:hypothetical protein
MDPFYSCRSPFSGFFLCIVEERNSQTVACSHCDFCCTHLFTLFSFHCHTFLPVAGRTIAKCTCADNMGLCYILISFLLPHVPASGHTTARCIPACLLLGFPYILILLLLPHISASGHSTVRCTFTGLLLVSPHLLLLHPCGCRSTVEPSWSNTSVPKIHFKNLWNNMPTSAA